MFSFFTCQTECFDVCSVIPSSLTRLSLTCSAQSDHRAQHGLQEPPLLLQLPPVLLQLSLQQPHDVPGGRRQPLAEEKPQQAAQSAAAPGLQKPEDLLREPVQEL